MLKTQKMKAFEGYTGPMFQVIHKAQREHRWNPQVHLGIVSAKYGFLRSSDYIEDYELRISSSLAQELNSQVIRAISLWHKETPFEEIYILMGKDYLRTVYNLESHVDTKIRIEGMGGTGLGQKKLKHFINENVPNRHSLLDHVI